MLPHGRARSARSYSALAKRLGKASTSFACEEMTVSAVIVRADGTREELGVIAHARFGLLARTSKRIRNWLQRLRR